jgi:hypothetical protein
MIEDTIARGLVRNTQRNHIHAGKLFAAYLKQSPDTATPDDGHELHTVAICLGNATLGTILSLRNFGTVATGAE